MPVDDADTEANTSLQPSCSTGSRCAYIYNASDGRDSGLGFFTHFRSLASLHRLMLQRQIAVLESFML